MKKIFTAFLIFLSAAFICAQAFKSEGETLFMQNNPSGAVLLLESEIAAGKITSNSYNFLGLSYYQLGDLTKALEVFQKGLTVSGTNKKILAFNAGNVCYALYDYSKAIEYYTLACKADPRYSQAVLNRANAYLMNQDFDNAIIDYERFLVMEPEDPQDPKIIELLALLRKEKIRLEEEKRLAEIEAARLAEEERLFQEEMARLEAEKAEAERQRLEAEKLQREEEERIAAEKRAEEERIAAERRAEEE
ncbi:MAG: tetratricopeptide repeat protein, partial [Treponema sp.]|nr:tetratricopeptide repeat protein [Treponema sp.]